MTGLVGWNLFSVNVTGFSIFRIGQENNMGSTKEIWNLAWVTNKLTNGSPTPQKQQRVTASNKKIKGKPP